MYFKILNLQSFRILTAQKHLTLLANRCKSTKSVGTEKNANNEADCPLGKKMSPATLESVAKVDIDPSGVFKYILIKVHGPAVNNVEPSIVILRGYKRCEYHSDIYDEVQPKLQPLDCEPLGGGRISHEPDNKKIHIYGYSQGYGKADHEVSAQLIKDAYPDYTVSISDEGY